VVKIKLIGWIADLAKFKEKEVKIDSFTRVKDLLNIEKIDEIDEERIIVLINGKPATLETEVKDSDQIVVMPVVGGGKQLYFNVGRVFLFKGYLPTLDVIFLE